MRKVWISIAVGAGFGLASLASAVHAGGGETSKDVIAVQLRKQGFKCTKALSAERDPQESKPDEPTWILTCDDARYKVRLVPNMAAHVEQLPDDDKAAAPKP